MTDQAQNDATVEDLGLVVDLAYAQDVPVTMRDGMRLRADVFRPRGEAAHPVLLSYGGYGKNLPAQDAYPEAWEMLLEQCPEVMEGSSCRLMSWELPDPERWVPLGYALVRVDARGTGRSPGTMDNMSAQEADDIYDAIEWAAEQSWSTGKIGLTGLSCMAIIQWTAAARRPPHLAAFLPWEGASDWYREVSRHGGILTDFPGNWFKSQPLKVQHGLGTRGWINSFTGEPACGTEELSDEDLERNRVEISAAMRERRLTTSTTAHGPGRWRTSRPRCYRPATGAAADSICAATSRGSRTHRRQTSGSRSTAVTTSRASTARRASNCSAASTTTS